MRSQRTLLTWVERQVQACRPLALRYFRSSSLRVTRKADLSPVTAADRAIEERLRRAIQRACPGESIVGEEYGRSGRDESSYWTIDPIDGTRAFSRGLPSWGIMVGRVERGKAVLGVIDYPAVGVRLMVAPGVPAVERTGSQTRRLPRVGSVRRLGDAVVFHGGFRWWTKPRYRAGLLRLLRSCFLERAYGDCYGFLWALRGSADVVLEYGVKPWDLVPLAAMARSTGRAFTDFSGRASFSGPEILMTHPRMTSRICRIVNPPRS